MSIVFRYVYLYKNPRIRLYLLQAIWQMYKSYNENSARFDVISSPTSSGTLNSPTDDELSGHAPEVRTSISKPIVQGVIF
jgi:hypothetical protein